MGHTLSTVVVRVEYDVESDSCLISSVSGHSRTTRGLLWHLVEPYRRLHHDEEASFISVTCLNVEDLLDTMRTALPVDTEKAERAAAGATWQELPFEA